MTRPTSHPRYGNILCYLLNEELKETTSAYDGNYIGILEAFFGNFGPFNGTGEINLNISNGIISISNLSTQPYADRVRSLFGYIYPDNKFIIVIVVNLLVHNVDYKEYRFEGYFQEGQHESHSSRNGDRTFLTIIK